MKNDKQEDEGEKKGDGMDELDLNADMEEDMDEGEGEKRLKRLKRLKRVLSGGAV